MTSRRRGARAAPRAPQAAPEPGPAERAVRWSGAAAAVLLTAALAVVAFAFHPVGDYQTESDFYSGYALGARALQRGQVDFGRYGVFGPVHEGLLALAGFVTPDLYTAARLVSVLAFGVMLLAWWRVAERRAGAVAALALTGMLAVNPTLVRYGYSVTTDLSGVAWFSLTVWASLALAGARAPLWAGVFAGLATLTRYNLVSLVPAALVVEALRTGRAPAARLRAAALVLVGALLPIAPWTIASAIHGHLPGETLFSDRGFYLTGDPGESLESRYRDLGERAFSRAAPDSAPAPARAVSPAGLARGALDHLARDARDLVGPPGTAVAVVGLLGALASGAGRALAPFAPFALFPFLALVPVFYTERYSMGLAPLALLPAAWLVARAARARWPRPAPALAAAALAALVIVPSLRSAVRYNRAILGAAPVETRAAGAALRRVASPGERVMARKAHVAWYAGLEPVPFPAFGTLASLAEFCRGRSVDYLYYSWYEAHLRPGFAFLLDTSAVVPGLEVVHATREPASVIYRLTPELGRRPDWWDDPATRERVAARVNASVLPPAEAAPFHLRLARWALERGRYAEALADARAALGARPGDAEARALEAEARRRLGR
jgi:hypothetical protein